MYNRMYTIPVLKGKELYYCAILFWFGESVARRGGTPLNGTLHSVLSLTQLQVQGVCSGWG